ncbi:methyl-accepting chemotaxis protein [Solirubrobacter ginsenosidimutans]|uniref:Methyl-accepting chemotaxis protein n=1 Tax=Solirubrobacter ginsenosidimutans TaxID=490573 RepID=A0A9X3S3P5_9ACTN|nr:HAMP domain-containing methyl-accepting chemotaxis protein [Solirubrobacter ginsenosidimutans]MDA0163667.1 methyl-accepting chemotaxis protein [Solirubrobacter ginsenosidimutans]
MSALTSRLGIRAQLLVAPAVVLILTAILGVTSIRQLSASAEMATQSAAETTAVEILRDSNSRQFEGDRFQNLALQSPTQKEFDDNRAEAADVMKESADGFDAFARGARTPALRADAEKQAALMRRIQSERERAFALVHVGTPLSAEGAKIIEGVEALIEQADASNDALVTDEQKITDRIAKDASATAARGKRLVVILLALAALLAALVSFAMAQPLVRAARRLLAAAGGISAGDLDQDVNVGVGGELGATAEAFEDMVAYLREMELAAQRIADGDLTADVEPKSDRDALGHALRGMTLNLRAMIGEVVATAGTVSTSSDVVTRTSDESGRAVAEIAGAMAEITSGAEAQLRMVSSANESAAEMSRAVDASAEAARQSADAAQEAHELAREGVAAVIEATTAMNAVRDSSRSASLAMTELEGKSGQIGSIVQRITEIAEQTNLLALNAAIEAARAGENGKGFAVVADEVRRLAENAGGAAREIAGLIAEIQSETRAVVAIVSDGVARTEEGTGTVELTRHAFERIDAAIEKMNVRIGEVADTAREVAAGTETLRSDLNEVAGVAERSTAASEQVSAAAQQTTASSTEITSSAARLHGTAEELQGLVSRFRLTA